MDKAIQGYKSLRWKDISWKESLSGLAVRALTQNVGGMWFDSHPKLIFSVFIYS